MADTVAPVNDRSTTTPLSRNPVPGPSDDEGLPIKMLNDRILVCSDTEDGERRSTGGILIPATAQVGKRLAWAQVVAAGPNVRTMEVGDQVLFNPRTGTRSRSAAMITSSSGNGTSTPWPPSVWRRAAPASTSEAARIQARPADRRP